MATAESCTGGGIAAALTARAGSSAWFAGGIVSYSNAMKENLLGVRREVLASEGAVSEDVVLQMAEGVMAATGADCSVSVSGIAGPDGGTPEKPVGTVWIGWGVRDTAPSAECFRFEGSREEVQAAAIHAGIAGLVRRLQPG
ncbi:nicotinamide-nucleotide amidohydrolase family protein [Biformimicrobium ophioploci]|uniref:Nicotinamide-nucleotide amidohydrolase family protein n=2 Tax=Biformimicrobium ophioploci TaxID=3036711 RepID=A0ABQ6LXY7_9GAMM|nr:nicotinamide-nucleotide amidohydrolase family protein [Microbulbifer sp. NKW57]